MKRIINSLIIVVLVLIIGAINVKAYDYDYYLSNSDSNYKYVEKNDVNSIDVKRGDTFTIAAVINNVNHVNNERLSDGRLTIRWDEKCLSLLDVNGKPYNESTSNIEGLTIGSVSRGSSKLVLSGISSTGDIEPSTNVIVELKFKVLDDANTGETKIYQMDGEDTLKCFNSVDETTNNCAESLYSEFKYNIKKSNINKLTSIKINGMELEYFNEDNNNYDLEVDNDVDKVNIEVTKKDSKSVISGNYGDNPLKYGINKFVIHVVSEAGEKNTYNINITRADARSSVNTLKTLTLSDGEITFNPNTTEYNISVLNNVEKITITSSLTDPKSRYADDFKERTINLVEGSNKVEIVVISERNEERTYTLNINRALSSNNSLKSLKVNDEKVELKENEFIYNIILENEVDEVVIKAEPNDSKATVKLDDKYPLEIGENEIKIVVTAADGKEASYILNVTRSKLLSKDSLLTSISIKGYKIDFKQNVTTYDLKIKDSDEKLEITTTQEDPNATVEIEGNKDLIDGSIIKINVKAEDGTFTRYFIRIEKGYSGISPIVIILIILFLLLGACVGLIIYRKKKKEKEEFDKIENEKIKPNNDDNNNLLEKSDVGEINSSEEISTPSSQSPGEEYQEDVKDTINEVDDKNENVLTDTDLDEIFKKEIENNIDEKNKDVE